MLVLLGSLEVAGALRLQELVFRFQGRHSLGDFDELSACRYTVLTSEIYSHDGVDPDFIRAPLGYKAILI